MIDDFLLFRGGFDDSFFDSFRDRTSDIYRALDYALHGVPEKLSAVRLSQP